MQSRRSKPHIDATMTLDFTADDTAALAPLKHAIEYDPFPYARALYPLKAILATV